MIQIRDERSSKSYQVYEPSDICRALTDTINFYKSQYERIKNENIKMRVSAVQMVKEEFQQEIDKLKTKNFLSYGEFASVKEKEAYEDFEQRHMHDRKTSAVNSGRAPYLIPTGTGLGTILKVKCPICGEEEDITDTGAW